jgi:hypothetical protein
MPNEYHYVLIALDDAIMALQDALDASTAATALPPRVRDRLTAMVAAMEEIQAGLAPELGAGARERHEEDLLEAMDDRSRSTP